MVLSLLKSGTGVGGGNSGTGQRERLEAWTGSPTVWSRRKMQREKDTTSLVLVKVMKIRSGRGENAKGVDIRLAGGGEGRRQNQRAKQTQTSVRRVVIELRASRNEGRGSTPTHASVTVRQLLRGSEIRFSPCAMHDCFLGDSKHHTPAIIYETLDWCHVHEC